MGHVQDSVCHTFRTLFCLCHPGQLGQSASRSNLSTRGSRPRVVCEKVCSLPNSTLSIELASRRSFNIVLRSFLVPIPVGLCFAESVLCLIYEWHRDTQGGHSGEELVVEHGHRISFAPRRLSRGLYRARLVAEGKMAIVGAQSRPHKRNTLTRLARIRRMSMPSRACEVAACGGKVTVESARTPRRA